MDWMERAAAYTGCPQALAAALLPHLTPDGALVDLGCGLGLVDAALSKSLHRITCLDIDAAPLERLSKKGYHNIETVRGDSGALTGVWDDVLLVAYGRLGENAASYLEHCRHGVVSPVRVSGAHAFQAGRGAHTTAAETARALDAQHIPYRTYPVELDHGQPFVDRAEAEDFVAEYGCAHPAAFLADKLVETGRDDFPLYLPNRKKYEIFVLPKGSAV